MKKLLILPLIIVAAGCGSQTGATSTVTSPPKTVTVTKVDKTASLTGSACKQAMEMMITIEGHTLDAAQDAMRFQYTKASHALTTGVTPKLHAVKPLVDLCRMG